MAIKISQSLKQSQNLAMTPQLQQAIKMLTLTHLEMTDVISKEMVDNPMLEEAGVDGSDDKSETDFKEEKLELENKEASAENFEDTAALKKEADDFDWQNYVESFENNSSTPPSISAGDLDEMPNYENIISRGDSLAEHLEWQLKMDGMLESEFKFARKIIHNINEDGYLDIPFEEVAKDTDLDMDKCLEIWDDVKRLDPVGCGSESLTDCLLYQAYAAEERSPLLEKIIRNHLEDLKNRDFKKIADATGVSTDQVLETAELLQNFHPKPGRLVSPGEIHYVTPDIYVIKVGDEFVVQVNDEGVPRLKISKLYRDMITNIKDKNDPTREFVQEKLKSAMWLIKSIQTRQKTIYRVAESIVRRQQEFFKKGPKYLKPMILKNIAEEIGMHESTVSRVTTNKYMHTPIGLFELKYFFSTGLGGKNGGTDVASEVLKLKIKELVGNENPKKPLSDQKIADLLGQGDVKVARRTVAKYREALGILPSSKRKDRS